MFCTNCGSKNSTGKYCKKCGHRVEESKTDQDADKNSTSPPKQKSNGCLKTCLIVFGIIFIITLIGMFSGAKKYFGGITNTSPTPTSNKTETPTSGSSTTNTKTSKPTPTPTQEKPTQTPTEAAKKWYYLIGCSDCQNPSCQTRYYYDGDNEAEYYNVKAWCESCTCNNLKGRSYQR